MPNINNSTVVASAHNTSGNGGRRLITLKNRWLVSAVSDTVNDKSIFYVSKDNGLTWTQLCFISSYGKPVITSVGNMIYVFARAYNTATTSALFWEIDATTVQNIDIVSTWKQFEFNQTNWGDMSITANPKGTELHATWSSKNPTYPNCPNIRYVRGIINGDGSVAWESVQQITTRTAVTENCSTPCIILDKDDKPSIIYTTWGSGVVSAIRCMKFTTVWTDYYVYNTGASTYTQYNPSAIFVPQSVNGLAEGRMWVSWHGTDGVDTLYPNIRASYSDDGGVTWSAVQKLTTGNVYTNQLASITANYLNEIFIYFEGDHATSGGVRRIRKVKWSASAWSSAVDVTTVNSGNPSTLFDLSVRFTEPLFIRTDYSKILFSGIFTVTTISDTDSNLGSVTSLSKTYTIANTDITTLSVTEKVDGTVLRTYTATMGATNTLDLSSTWSTLSYTTHTVTIECDGSVRTFTLTKIYGTNSKPSEMISALLSLTGINQKADLKTALETKGLTIASSDGIADMIGELSSANLVLDGRKFATGTYSHSGTRSFTLSDNTTVSLYHGVITGLDFVPSYIVGTMTTNVFPIMFYNTVSAPANKEAYLASTSNGWGIRKASITTDNITYYIPVNSTSSAMTYAWFAIE